MAQTNSPRKNALLRLAALAYLVLLIVFVLPFVLVFVLLVMIWSLLTDGLLGWKQDDRLEDIASELFTWINANVKAALAPKPNRDTRIQLLPRGIL